MPVSQPHVEYVAHTRIGEKGQLTVPKPYRDELGLETGAPVAVLRIGEGLILVPEQSRLRILCDSIASVLERRQLSATDLLDTLPAARRRVFLRHYSGPADPKRRVARRSKAR